jgi:tetratricopeptide (TPR) repeat protein
LFPAQSFADMSMPRPFLILSFLLALCFTLATWLEPRSEQAVQAAGKGGMLKTLLGDGRRMFANHFYTKADIYFHSGYYPSLFEQAQRAAMNSKHLLEEAKEHEGQDGHDSHEEEEHEKAMNFLGQPQDWIDRFGRHFYPSTHSHLDKPGEAKEILPWLRLSAELDPKRVDTYTLGAYWMTKNMRKPLEAEKFLRDGLRENPTSYEILFELGLLYHENLHEPIRARNLWEVALRRWKEQDAAGEKPDEIECDKILANLARVEEEQGNLAKARDYLEQEVKYTPSPDAVKKHIEELKEGKPRPVGK